MKLNTFRPFRPFNRLDASPSLSAVVKSLAAKYNGMLWDAQSFAGLYQDSAGTTPVTALGQPVGMMLGARAAGGERGPESLVNGDFSAGATGWTVTGADATHIATFANGTLRYRSDKTAPILSVTQAAVTAGKTYEVTVVCSSWVSGSVKVFEQVGGMLVVGGVGVFRAIITAAGSNAAIARNSANVDLTLDSISVREVPGATFTQATTTKRPTLQQAANGSRYLAFDGVDDGMVTAANVDLTATDAVTAGLALHKASDAAGALVLELSPLATGNNGTFAFYAPSGGLAGFVYTSRGTANANASSGNSHPAPTTRTVVGISKISTDVSLLRVDGVQAASSLTDQGAGNYGSYPLYLGGRTASAFFNGRIYRAGLFPVQLAGSELKLFEQWLARPLGVTIP